MVVRAICDINPGEQLCVTYINLMEPRWLRQKILLDTRFFSCSCSRCSEDLFTSTDRLLEVQYHKQLTTSTTPQSYVCSVPQTSISSFLVHCMADCFMVYVPEKGKHKLFGEVDGWLSLAFCRTCWWEQLLPPVIQRRMFMLLLCSFPLDKMAGTQNSIWELCYLVCSLGCSMSKEEVPRPAYCKAQYWFSWDYCRITMYSLWHDL